MDTCMYMYMYNACGLSSKNGPYAFQPIFLCLCIILKKIIYSKCINIHCTMYLYTCTCTCMYMLKEGASFPVCTHYKRTLYLPNINPPL